MRPLLALACFAVFAAVLVGGVVWASDAHTPDLTTSDVRQAFDLTTSDVRKAFAREGISLVPDQDKAPYLHFLWYGPDGGNGERLAVFVYDAPTGVIDARNLAKSFAGALGISEELLARNVLVVVLHPATRDERRRAHDAVTALRRK